MSRVAGWPSKMIAVINTHAAMPFEWGTSDCMQLCMDVAEAITGAHPYPDAKEYKTKDEAMECLKRHGFSNIVEALHAAYPPVGVSLAQRGDIGIVSINEILASCVCEGMQFVGKAPGHHGVIRVPRSKVVQAFKVS